ncbi:hypothetical protein XCR1_880015 [Xenorhabdus cabanillasii JM26]|uniref:Uncharacterized protein n=1 Tax=Xenorhabdus cabanillasii JM26 TaxID=1427517 RepID=W1J971_9GAMM|nr:hypothetical protein XCR1_880015 [Xenorhabdus cabanillasii JM26]
MAFLQLKTYWIYIDKLNAGLNILADIKTSIKSLQYYIFKLIFMLVLNAKNLDLFILKLERLRW